jgi:hypothetical protein
MYSYSHCILKFHLREEVNDVSLDVRQIRLVGIPSGFTTWGQKERQDRATPQVFEHVERIT